MFPAKISDGRTNWKRGSGDSFYFPELDSLRFFAFVIVFFYHAAPEARWYAALHIEKAGTILAGAFSAGQFGVDLFFGLSAYLITSLLFREQDSRGSINVGAFYLRRILRIWPLYFAFILIAWKIIPLAMPTEHLTGGYVAAFFLLSGNWVCAIAGYPASVIVPLWSISIEEQFYLVWPALFKATRKRLLTTAIAMLVVANAARLVLLFGTNPVHPAVWCNTFARLDPIAVGIMVAIWTKGKRVEMPSYCRLALAAGCGAALIAVGALCGLDSQTLSVPGNLIGYPVVAFAVGGLLVSVLGTSARLMHGSVFVWLGQISYGLYVFHLFTLRACRELFHPHGAKGFIVYRLAALMLTIALAAASYRWFEAPFLTLKKRFATVPVVRECEADDTAMESLIQTSSVAAENSF